MILKNITNSRRELADGQTGECISVEAGKTVELRKPRYESNSFEVVKEEKLTKLKEDK
ncbi:MAG: hypothetical protein ACTSU7_00240 [Candidatus Heimdallarchaeaceae archaeon]